MAGERELEDYDCEDCLRVLLWSWGHGRSTRIQVVQEKISTVKQQMQTRVLDFGGIASLLEDIERIVAELDTFSSPFQIETVHLNWLVADRIRQLEQMTLHPGVSFNLDLDPNEPVIRVSPQWLRRLLDILIDNAVHAHATRVELVTRVDGRAAKILVQDNGQGILACAMSRMFAKPDVGCSPVRGRGLYIARTLAEIYQGGITMASSSPLGTTMVVYLPLESQNGN